MVVGLFLLLCNSREKHCGLGYNCHFIKAGKTLLRLAGIRANLTAELETRQTSVHMIPLNSLLTIIPVATTGSTDVLAADADLGSLSGFRSEPCRW